MILHLRIESLFHHHLLSHSLLVLLPLTLILRTMSALYSLIDKTMLDFFFDLFLTVIDLLVIIIDPLVLVEDFLLCRFKVITLLREMLSLNLLIYHFCLFALLFLFPELDIKCVYHLFPKLLTLIFVFLF